MRRSEGAKYIFFFFKRRANQYSAAHNPASHFRTNANTGTRATTKQPSPPLSLLPSLPLSPAAAGTMLQLVTTFVYMDLFALPQQCLLGLCHFRVHCLQAHNAITTTAEAAAEAAATIGIDWLTD